MSAPKVAAGSPKGREIWLNLTAQKKPVPVRSWNASTKLSATVVHFLCAPIICMLYSSPGLKHASMEHARFSAIAPVRNRTQISTP